MTSRTPSASDLWAVMFCCLMSVATAAPEPPAAPPAANPTQKTESFNDDPKWDSLNNRAVKPRTVKQDFGYNGDGKIGGTIAIAGEPAYYAKKITPKSLNDPLTASGTLLSGKDNGMALIGFFNADTAQEWRTRNSLALRILGRGKQFYVYEEYCTSRWRAGSNQFTGPGDKEREKEPGFAGGGDTVHTWALRYDPNGNDGGGAITAIVDGKQTVTNLNPGHKLDGATFTHFGLLNVMKHADDPQQIFIGDVTINGEKQDLSKDPQWDAFQNRRTYETRDDRPYSDYGFSDTNFAGGKARGELGGLIFRGDIRLPDGVNYYGDRVELLSLEKPLKASGKLVYRRGVQDGSTLIGFFHVPDSVTINPNAPKSPRSWFDYLPKNFFGVCIKGPTREGYFFHPTYRLNGDEGGGNPGNAIPNCPRLGPDGKPRDWSFEYAPAAGGNGNGQVKVTLDGQSATLDVPAAHQSAGARFNRFGIVSNWVDGNGQVVYIDDVTYTASQGAAK